MACRSTDGVEIASLQVRRGDKYEGGKGDRDPDAHLYNRTECLAGRSARARHVFGPYRGAGEEGVTPGDLSPVFPKKMPPRASA
jgi:hypothetical protein